jgi:hypothetical protein
MSGRRTWLNLETEFLSGDLTWPKLSKKCSNLSGFAPGLFQKNFKIRPDWHQGSPTTITQGPEKAGSGNQNYQTASRLIVDNTVSV